MEDGGLAVTLALFLQICEDYSLQTAFVGMLVNPARALRGGDGCFTTGKDQGQLDRFYKICID